jgi:multisubunit Na+/H+ antiporter MnhF subunit
MAEPHPAATHYLPSFITAPGETDVLMVVMGLFLALAVVMFGVLFLRLHSLPDHIAHKSSKMQAEIVGVLCLIALFTHMHIFWVAALLLAMIDLPDFGTSLGRIADSTETLAGRKPREGAAELPPETMVGVKKTDAHEAIEKEGEAKQGSGAVSTKPDFPKEPPFDRHAPIPLRHVKGT